MQLDWAIQQRHALTRGDGHAQNRCSLLGSVRRSQRRRPVPGGTVRSDRRRRLQTHRAGRDQVRERATRTRTDGASADPLSFYGGITGLAYATWRVGEQTEEQTPTSMLFEALSMASSSLAMDTEAEDFLGYASAIGALTSLARWAKSPQCREQALTIGRKLCRSELIARYAAAADAAGEPRSRVCRTAPAASVSACSRCMLTPGKMGS